MSLQTGQQFGSYEITALLGKGGMGEVYRARDLKVKRDVAIKVLPDSFSNDSEHLARFRREAEVLGSLNHPNIGAIYHLDEAAGLPVLVLELVEGETLTQRIARGRVPVRESVLIARNIADALEAARELCKTGRFLKISTFRRQTQRQVWLAAQFTLERQQILN